MEKEVVERWFSDGGDERFRYNYPLDSNSLVFDLGGYEGKFAKGITDRYACKVWIFEPMKNNYHKICELFKRNTSVKVFDIGFSSYEGTSKIYHSNDASTTINYNNFTSFEEIKIRKCSDFIKENNLKIIDLLKVNIEGAEYDVMEDLIESGLLSNFKNIQIQFHNFSSDAPSRRDNIREHLKKTHKETYCYEFVWENWTLI